MIEFAVITKGVRFHVRREGLTYHVTYGDQEHFCMTWRGVMHWIDGIV